MTKKNEVRIWDALITVRGALRGWAFAHNPHAYVEAAEKAAAKLAPEFIPYAEKMIDEVRRAIAIPNVDMDTVKKAIFNRIELG